MVSTEFKGAGLHYTAFRDAIREDSRQTTPSRGVTPRKKFAVEANVESRVKKPLYIRHLNRRTPLPQILLDPPLLRLACRNDLRAPPQKEPLNRPDKPLLPPMEPEPHRIIARLRHPSDIPPPDCCPPQAWQPSTVNPHFVRRAQLAHLRPRRKRYLMAFAALLVHDHPRDIRRAVPRLPAGAYVENIHFMKLAISMPRTSRRKRPPAADPLQRKGE